MAALAIASAFAGCAALPGSKRWQGYDPELHMVVSLDFRAGELPDNGWLVHVPKAEAEGRFSWRYRYLDGWIEDSDYVSVRKNAHADEIVAELGHYDGVPRVCVRDPHVNICLDGDEQACFASNFVHCTDLVERTPP
jgi:hypothetical protein